MAGLDDESSSRPALDIGKVNEEEDHPVANEEVVPNYPPTTMPRCGFTPIVEVRKADKMKSPFTPIGNSATTSSKMRKASKETTSG